MLAGYLGHEAARHTGTLGLLVSWTAFTAAAWAGALTLAGACRDMPIRKHGSVYCNMLAKLPQMLPMP